MQRVIKNGVTILTFPPKPPKEKTIYYRVDISVNKKRYYIGARKTPEEAQALRNEAQAHINDGTFLEWRESILKR